MDTRDPVRDDRAALLSAVMASFDAVIAAYPPEHLVPVVEDITVGDLAVVVAALREAPSPSRIEAALRSWEVVDGLDNGLPLSAGEVRSIAAHVASALGEG